MARQATHRVCENHLKLTATALTRGGLMNGSGTLSWSDGSQIAVSGYEDSVKLTYAVDGAAVVQRIMISKTPAHLGGHRAWFICPGCSKRISALYLAKQFRCRHCHDLRYQSQRETPVFRAIDKIQRIRKKLSGSTNLTQPIPARPRYMHNHTYRRLLSEEAAAWQAYFATS